MLAIVSTLSTLLLAAAAALTPTKTWYAPNQPLTIEVQADAPATLVLTDFSGRRLTAEGPADVDGGKAVDLRQVFPQQLKLPGTYVLYLYPRQKQQQGPPEGAFLGTPFVIGVREDKRRGAAEGPMVVKVEPLRYAVMHTQQGPMTMAFYYDVAPNTVASFLSLAEGGYFDGLVFHRILADFVLQGGDPRGTDPNPEIRGTGGPGYQLEAELSDRPHLPGVLSMARGSDPNSAGSQFFVCLNYDNTKHLDNQYTAFGQVVEGMDAAQKIAKTPVEADGSGRPKGDPPVIEKVEVKAVTAGENPYVPLMKAIQDQRAGDAAPPEAPPGQPK